MQLLNGDCLQEMLAIPDKTVGLILTDLPYGTTACKWDTIIPFEPLWAQYRRVIKDNAAIVLTASQPFTSVLVASNIKQFKYSWIWDKTRGSNFQNARFQPMKSHEDILVFGSGKIRYYPQYWYGKPYETKARERKSEIEGLSGGSAANYMTATISEDGKRYPLSILRFKRDADRVHPTQKPVALMEYLIRTYTNEGDLVVDSCMGSGTTGVACVNTKREFIGIEKDTCIFDGAVKRIGIATHERLQLLL
jgi:site-specific DNA-methyltransferase (adenine-specific)